MREVVLAVAALAAAGCEPADGPPAVEAPGAGATPGAAAAPDFSGGEWVDLTHPFSSETVYWPTASGFELDTIAYGETEGGYFYSAFGFSADEHGGTHLDAPLHFARGAWAADEIPLERLIGAAVVVEPAGLPSGPTADLAPDYQVSVSDLEAWEAEHGRIPDGAILLLNTRWARRWGDPAQYLGTAETGPDAVPQLHFPGLAPDAARWLVENRDVAAVGIDTPSIDYGQSTDFRSHVILYSANIPGFENVANLEALPATGAVVFALPMKIEGGSGGPLRIVAWVPDGGG